MKLLRPGRALLVALGALLLLSGRAWATPTPTIVTVWPAYSGDLTFSPDGSQVTYYQTDQSGTFNLSTNTGTLRLMVSNVDGTNAHCVSCVPPAPTLDVDGGTWSADGFIAAVGLEPNTGTQWLGHSGIGYYLLTNGAGMSLYFATPGGQHWYKVRPLGVDGNKGILPQITFSPDGKTVVFAEMMQAADKTYTEGLWKMFKADVVVAADGTPSLQNVTDITPPYPGLYEPGAITPDGQYLIYNASSSPPAPTTGEGQIYMENLTNHQVTALTANSVWNEHVILTPDGKEFIWLHNGEVYVGNVADAPTDGVKLSGFNGWDSSIWSQARCQGGCSSGTSTQWPLIPFPKDISRDGTKVSFQVQSIWNYPTTWAAVATYSSPLG